MTASQHIQHCIQQCMQVRDQLNSMAGMETNQQMKMMFLEGSHHLNLCIEECNFTMMKAGATV